MTTFTLEIELAISAAIDPADPSVGIMASQVIDRDIDGAYAMGWDAKLKKHIAVDLLKGIDRKSEAYNQLISNILAFVGDDADEAIISDLSE